MFRALVVVGTLLLARVGDCQVAPPEPNLPPLLTLEGAVAIYRNYGLDLLLADAQVEAASADTGAAGAIANPVLGGSVGKTFNYSTDPAKCGGPDCSSIPWSVGLSDQAALLDTLIGKRRTRVAVAQAALEAAKRSRTDALRTGTFLVEQQYLEVLYAQDSFEFLKEVQTALGEIVALKRIRYRAGAISEAELAKMETAKLEADEDVYVAEQAVRTAKVSLAFLLGVRGPIPSYKVEADLLRFHVPPALLRAGPETLIPEAFAHRSDFKAIEYQRLRAQASIAWARRLRAPDLALSAQFSTEGWGQTALQPPTLTFGLSLPLPVFYQYQGEIKRAQADFYMQTLAQARLAAQIVSDVEGAYAAFSGARKRVEHMESQLLGRAKRARDLIQVQYQKGAASLLEYLDAQRTYMTTYLGYLKDLTDYWIAVFQLEQAVGVEFRRS